MPARRWRLLRCRCPRRMCGRIDRGAWRCYASPRGSRRRSRCGAAVYRASCRAGSGSSGFWWMGCWAGCRAPGGRLESGCCHSRGHQAVHAPMAGPGELWRRPRGRWSRLRSVAGGPVDLSRRIEHEVSSSARRGCVRCNVEHPFFARLSAVRCALRRVLSIISLSGTPACATKALKTRSNTPSRLHRTNLL